MKKGNLDVNNLEARLTELSPYVLAILRIMTALLFMAHGTAKLFGFPETGMSPPLLSLFGLAGVLEVVGGILLVIGLFSRPVAFILSGMMAVAYFMAHAPQNFYPILNGGESAILFCFVFLYLVFAGPGAWSLDRQRAGAGVPSALRA
ncbi:DoxX family protein [Chelativorans sp. J32]|uniref:DoxX family protein n=1 Tax=Chelativorans sp. J32 TaxID=935840 RepID=UPI000686615B|nr:DoxX family protein [Chelativorans sp. J32]